MNADCRCGNVDYDIAESMRRALLTVEWIDTAFFTTQVCPSCECTHFAGHVDCKLDTALTKAGLPDQASRNAARKELGL